LAASEGAMTLFENASSALHRRPWIAAALGLTLAVFIALADLLTPESISFSLFYLLPIALLAWFNGGVWPWLAALTGALLWPANHLDQGDFSHFRSVAAYWEPAARIGFYAVFIGFRAVIQGHIARLRDVNRDLHESEERYRQVFEHSSGGIILYDVTPDSRFLLMAANPAVERMTGIAIASAVGRFIEDIVPASTAELLVSNYRRCVKARHPIS
jgi:PAS domain-containing protein